MWYFSVSHTYLHSQNSPILYKNRELTISSKISVLKITHKGISLMVKTSELVAGARLELATFGLWVLVVIILYLFISIHNCLYLLKNQHFSIYIILYLFIFIHNFGRQMDVLSSRKLNYFLFIFVTPLFSFFTYF